MLVSLCNHLKRGRQGLEWFAYLTSLRKSYSVTLSTDSSIPSTTFPSESYHVVLKWDSEPPFPKIDIWNNVIFYCDSSLKAKNASEIIYPGCPKFKPTQCSCVLVGCMILMFSKFLNSHCFYHTRRCPKTDHHFTLLIKYCWQPDYATFQNDWFWSRANSCLGTSQTL